MRASQPSIAQVGVENYDGVRTSLQSDGQAALTKSEFQQLVEFLGIKLDATDRRLEGIDRRLRRVEMFGEDTCHRVELLAEGLGAFHVQVDRHFDAVDREFGAVRAEMVEGSRVLTGRIDRLERAS